MHGLRVRRPGCSTCLAGQARTLVAKACTLLHRVCMCGRINQRQSTIPLEVYLCNLKLAVQVAPWLLTQLLSC